MTDQQLLELLHTEPQKGLEDIIRQYAGDLDTILKQYLQEYWGKE